MHGPTLDQCQIDCSKCKTGSCCLGQGLTEEQSYSLRRVARSHAPYQAGQAIYKMEDDFKSLYIIHSGSVKIETVSADGNNLVDGFLFKGELLGLEAIGDNKNHHDAIALEETHVSELPFEQFEDLCTFTPRLQHRVLTLLGQKIRNTTQTIVHSRHLSAERRLLLFFGMLCQKKVAPLVDNTTRIHLPMSKGDIASYLGLRPESLSRALTKLQRSGYIRNQTKLIELLDINALCRAGAGEKELHTSPKDDPARQQTSNRLTM